MRRERTPARMVWQMISAEMARQKMTQEGLAKLAGCSRNTVSLDSKDPERIPMCRVWTYFAALGIDCTEVLKPIAHEIAEAAIKRRPE